MTRPSREALDISVEGAEVVAQEVLAPPERPAIPLGSDEVIIVPAVSDEEAKKKFPGGWRAPKPYMRFVPQPED